MKTIVYIGNFKFSLENAESQLVLGNARILRDLGYEVVFIGNTDSPDVSEDPIQNREYVEDYVVYNIKFRKNPKEIVNIPRYHKSILEILAQYPKLAAVIFYSSPTLACQIDLIIRWCRKKGVATIANCADFSATSHGTIFQRILKTVDIHWRYYLFRNKTDGIIAVSKYIAEYYSKGKKKQLVIIPPLKDCSLIPPPVYTGNKIIQILYAGLPFPTDGRRVDVGSYKDRLDILIRLLVTIRGRVPAFHLNIYGLTKEQYLNVVHDQKVLVEDNLDIITFHGRVPHESTLKAAQTTDFSVLLRKKNSMTMAGFSTKFVESISCGVPMIVTETSDYREYVEEGKHAFFLNIEDEKRAVEELVAILGTGRNQINYMKQECYNSRMFDYRNYTEKMRCFLEKVLK